MTFSKIKTVIAWCVILQSLVVAAILLIGSVIIGNLPTMGLLYSLDIVSLCLIIYRLNQRR
jgi:hypothetical protein